MSGVTILILSLIIYASIIFLSCQRNICHIRVVNKIKARTVDVREIHLFLWCARRESNPYLRLRRPTSYPLDHGRIHITHALLLYTHTLLSATGIMLVPDGCRDPMAARVTDTTFVLACDVVNPLYGPNGASSNMVKQLDEALRHYVDIACFLRLTWRRAGSR